MEYDNDRLRRRTTRAETVCWVLVAFLGPIMDSIALAHLNVGATVAAFVISGIVFPLYLLYAYLMGTSFITRGPKMFPIRPVRRFSS